MSASNTGALAVIPPGFDPSRANALAALDPNWQASKGELSQGVRASYSVVRYKGKTWSIAYKGESHPVIREVTPGYREPSPSLEVVVIRGNPSVSKRFYKDKWVDGSTEAPDCKSTDGIKPDAGVKLPQAAACATCPMNAWGSRITEQGKQAKACSDTRRIAIVPLGDMNNETFGGPMLLTLPPASLQGAVNYESQLAQYGYPVHAVATRLTFDPAEAYPSIVMSAIRVLEPDEFTKIVALRDDPRVKHVLFDAAEPGAATPGTQEPPAPPPGMFEQPPVAPVPPAPVAPAAAAAPVPPAPVAPAQAVAQPAPPPPPPSAPPVVAAPAPTPAPVLATAGGIDLDAELDALFT
jgi:hypothetical protein